MNKEDIIDLLTSDYNKFFYENEVTNYSEELKNFISDNKDLSTDNFLEKFDKQFPAMKVIDMAISRNYLGKIASSLNTIKIIVIIYFIASIIAGLIYANEVIY